MNRLIATAAWRLPLHLVLLLLVTSCSSNASDSNEPSGTVAIAPYPDGAGPPPMEPKNCNSFPFERTEFEAGEAIVFSLPPDIDRAPERALWLHSDSLVIPYPLDIMTAEGVDERNGLFLPIPSSIGTTRYTLQLAGKLSDGTEFSCPTHDIEIKLSPAPGAAKEFAQKMSTILDGLAARHGGDRATLEAIAAGEDVGDIDGTLVPLAISHFYLRKRGDGLIDGLDKLSADELAYLDAGLAVIAEAAEVDKLASSFDGSLAGLSALQVDIQDASDLAFWAKERTTYCGALKTSYSKSVLAAGIVGIRANLIGVAATAYAQVGTILLEVAQAACDLLPARLVNLRVDTPTRVNEDEAGLVTVRFPIAVKSASILVDATSNKWSWLGSAIRVVLQTLSTGLAAKEFKAVVKALPENGVRSIATFLEVNKVPPATIEHVSEFTFEFLNVVEGFYLGELSSTKTLNEKWPQIGPFEWKDIGINDPRWIRIVSRTNVVRQFDDVVQRGFVYRFTRVGEDAVTFVPRVEEFPLRELEEKLLLMGVDKIDIDVPEEVLVTPGDTVTIPYSVDYANHPDLEWMPFQGAMSPQKTSEAVGTVDHIASSNEADFPYFIEVVPLSETGLREAEMNPPDRTKLITVRLGEVSLTPKGQCVSNGESLTLQVARNRGLEGQPETLTLVGEGTLEGRVYTAPAEGTGRVQITLEVGGVSDTTQLSYGRCECYFSVTSREGAHNREYGMVLTDFSIGDFVERGESVAPIVTMSMGESLTQILTDPRYILTFAPGFWKTATMREGLDGDFTADLRGESQFDAGWFSNGGYLETDALQYLGRPRLTGKGVVYHGDPENPFPVNVAFSMVFDDSICATESLFKGFTVYPDYPRPDVEVF